MPSAAQKLVVVQNNEPAVTPELETPEAETQAQPERPEELRHLEALLFASATPLDEATLAKALPATVKPGVYPVCLTVIQADKVVAKKCTDLKVAMVSFPAMLAAMAYNHSAAYGILAILIAIVTGFAMGYIFKGGGAH